MAENDLDKYLEDLGINIEDEDEDFELPVAEDMPQQVSVSLSLSQVDALEGSLAEKTESFLVDLLLNFDPSYSVEVSSISENEIRADIIGGNPGKIIGRGGNTLRSLEYLTNVIINRYNDSDEGVRVTVDVGGYKRRRHEKLAAMTQKIMARVRRENKPFALSPMSAAERRLVHIEVADCEDLISDSTGNGKGRRVVIKPAK